MRLRVYLHNAHEVTGELEDQLCDVRAAVAVNDEAEHHAECCHSTEDASHPSEAFGIVRESGNDILGRNLVDAREVSTRGFGGVFHDLLTCKQNHRSHRSRTGQ